MHRTDLGLITSRAQVDLAGAWTPGINALAAKAELRVLLLALVDAYGSAAATLGADFYDDLRDVAKVRRRFRAITASLPGAGAADALAGVSVGPLFGATPDAVAALTLAQGGLQRLISNVDRASITVSSVADPQCRGWQRVGLGGCSFCSMLLGRGAVYTEATADFEAHDHCRCSAEPAFG